MLQMYSILMKQKKKKKKLNNFYHILRIGVIENVKNVKSKIWGVLGGSSNKYRGDTLINYIIPI